MAEKSRLERNQSGPSAHGGRLAICPAGNGRWIGWIEDLRAWWPEIGFRADELETKVPVIGMFKERDDIVVKAEILGMDNHLEVNPSDHTLTIKGKKKQKDEIKEENYYRSERIVYPDT